MRSAHGKYPKITYLRVLEHTALQKCRRSHFPARVRPPRFLNFNFEVLPCDAQLHKGTRIVARFLLGSKKWWSSPPRPSKMMSVEGVEWGGNQIYMHYFPKTFSRTSLAIYTRKMFFGLGIYLDRWPCVWYGYNNILESARAWVFSILCNSAQMKLDTCARQTGRIRNFCTNCISGQRGRCLFVLSCFTINRYLSLFKSGKPALSWTQSVLPKAANTGEGTKLTHNSHFTMLFAKRVKI